MDERGLCLVFDFRDVESATEATDYLLGNELDVEREGRRVWVYAPALDDPDRLGRVVADVLQNCGQTAHLVGPGRLRRWDETRHRFLDPRRPDRDPDTGELFDGPFADETTWVVKVEPRSDAEPWLVVDGLLGLGRPLLGGDSAQGYELGAPNEQDATLAAVMAAGLPGVARATPRRLGLIARWRLRQRYGVNWAQGAPGYAG